MNNKIVITGATGFVGSNLVTFFLKKNFDIYLIVRENSDLSNISTESSNLKIFKLQSNNIF